MNEPKLNKATFKGITRYFESISKSMKESSDMWQYELNGDELVTLKDGRDGTLGGLIYDEDNTFIGYEFSENPYGGYNYEEIKPEDIEKVSDIYADEDLMEALNEISDDLAISQSKLIEADSTITRFPKTLSNLLRKCWYDGNGRYASIGKWEIGLGGYDYGYEVEYMHQPIFRITPDNEVEMYKSDVDMKLTCGYNYAQIMNALKQVKPNLELMVEDDDPEDEDLVEALNEISREKANKVVKRRADQQYDAIQDYDVNKPETVKALHNAEDKLDKALRLRRNSNKLRKDESKINESDKYHHLGKDGELLTPEESNNKMCNDPISTVKNTNKSGNIYFTASYSCGGLKVTRRGKTEEAARKALKKVLKTKHNINLDEAEIKGNNLDSKWVIRAWVDNMDSEDGYDEIEFTKIGLIDFINQEEEK